MDPAGDPLGFYARYLNALKDTVSEDVLVLPRRNLLFYGLHQRADELLLHHASRCAANVDASRIAGRTAVQLVPAVFRSSIDVPQQMGFAFSKTLARVPHVEVERNRAMI